jgi:6-phosphogluconolactonase
MNGDVRVFQTKIELAEAAASHAIATLNSTIQKQGHATWVLAGGTTPELAYQIIADNYLGAVDWSKVTFIMGDERIAPLDSPQSNWHAAETILLRHIPHATFLRPHSDVAAEQGAGEYDQIIAGLPKNNTGLPQLDLVWLGMGEDGHTLSLFPHHPGLGATDRYVIPIHNSPKPPADRISLTFAALRGAVECVIMASGSSKAHALKQIKNGVDLPVARAATYPAHTTWLVDRDANDTQNT